MTRELRNLKSSLRSEPVVSFNVNESTKLVLATTATSREYFSKWEAFSAPSWLAYAEKFGLGVVVATEDLLPLEDPKFKNGSWQKMLLPGLLATEMPSIERVCLLDTDVVVSPRAPNIFEIAPEGEYSVVSQEKGLPFDVVEARRRVAFERNSHYSSDYPLDSLLLADAAEEFRQQGLPPRDNFFCAGLIVCDVAHAEQLRDWFYSVENDIENHVVAWEQTHLNHWIQGEKHSWLPYRFQALWHYEMAWNHPHLYSLGEELCEAPETAVALTTALWNNYFLHFAGSWHESLAWSVVGGLMTPEVVGNFGEFDAYLGQKITPRNLGKILPRSPLPAPEVQPDETT
jgi:hypothetical protein